jgi:hypothetical protein
MTRPLDDNPFVGGPRPEHDEAWGKLVEPMIIKLTPEEYENANLGVETIGFADGSGYLGELAVYHELHCVKRIRRHLHLKHYYPDLSDNDYRIEGIHIGTSCPLVFFIYSYLYSNMSPHLSLLTALL